MLVSRLAAWVKSRRWVSRAPDRSGALVSQGLTLAGDLQISADTLQIDGCVMGDVLAKSSTVTIGPSGSVVGTIFADTIYLSGQAKGQMLAVHQIACAASANFEGHMQATLLSIDLGARVSGTMALRGEPALASPISDRA